MRRLVSLALTLLSVLFFLSSCEKAPFVTLTGSRSLTFARQGGSQTISFSCNRNWSVSSSENWVQISPSSGEATDGDIKVTITCSPNTTYDLRVATLTVKVEEMVETISVTQEAGLGLLVSPTDFDLTNAEQTIEVAVQQNVNYTVGIDEAGKDWIKRGSTKALSTDKVTFNIAANKSYDDREGKIYFYQTDGGFVQTVTVRQGQANGLFITTPEYDLSNEAHTLSVELKANVQFEVTSQADWIKFVETKALTPSSVVLSIDANDTYDRRTGTVLVKQTNGDLTSTITINQDHTNGLFVTPTSAEVSSQAQTIDLEIKDNVPYSVVIPDDAKDWISIQSDTQTKSLSEDKVVLAIGQNTSDDFREASITIKQVDGSLAETVTIKQSFAESILISKSEYEISSVAQTLEVEVNSNVEYEVSPNVDWITVVSTKALSSSKITLNISANETYSSRTGIVSVKQKGGTLAETITITQAQYDIIIVSPTSFELTNERQSITIEVQYNIPYIVEIPKAGEGWITIDSAPTTKALGAEVIKLCISSNNSDEERSASVSIRHPEFSYVCSVDIKQAAADSNYESSDFSKNGTWKKLQSANTEGNGLNIVFLGDAYTDTMIADGTYDDDMARAMEHFFEVEPYASLRGMFNCYEVYAVSKNNNYKEGASTAFQCQFGSGTNITGQDDKVRMYAQKVTEIQNGDPVHAWSTYIDGEEYVHYSDIPGGMLCVVVLNSTRYAGTSSMSTDGTAVAYCPLQSTNEKFGEVIHHEAGGHGFARLADEYGGSYYTIPKSRKNNLLLFQEYGFYQNVDLTDNPETIRWSKFLSDSRYSGETGIYEGGYLCNSGVWRPSENSIMRDNKGIFNAPSREIIYRRVMELSKGSSYSYDFEDFASFDASYKAQLSATGGTTSYQTKSHSFEPYAEPVITIR